MFAMAVVGMRTQIFISKHLIKIRDKFLDSATFRHVPVTFSVVFSIVFLVG